MKVPLRRTAHLLDRIVRGRGRLFHSDLTLAHRGGFLWVVQQTGAHSLFARVPAEPEGDGEWTRKVVGRTLHAAVHCATREADLRLGDPGDGGELLVSVGSRRVYLFATDPGPVAVPSLPAEGDFHVDDLKAADALHAVWRWNPATDIYAKAGVWVDPSGLHFGGWSGVRGAAVATVPVANEEAWLRESHLTRGIWFSNETVEAALRVASEGLTTHFRDDSDGLYVWSSPDLCIRVPARTLDRSYIPGGAHPAPIGTVDAAGLAGALHYLASLQPVKAGALLVWADIDHRELRLSSESVGGLGRDAVDLDPDPACPPRFSFRFDASSLHSVLAGSAGTGKERVALSLDRAPRNGPWVLRAAVDRVQLHVPAVLRVPKGSPDWQEKNSGQKNSTQEG